MPISVVATSAIVFVTGKTARMSGLRRESCPYPNWMTHAKTWLDGWHSVPEERRSEANPLMPFADARRFLSMAEAGKPAIAIARQLKMEIEDVNRRLRTEGLERRKIAWLKASVRWRNYERLHLDVRLNAGHPLHLISREMGRRINDVEKRIHHMSQRSWMINDSILLRDLQGTNADLETMVLELDRTSQAIGAECALLNAHAERRRQLEMAE